MQRFVFAMFCHFFRAKETAYFTLLGYSCFNNILHTVLWGFLLILFKITFMYQVSSQQESTESICALRYKGQYTHMVNIELLAQLMNWIHTCKIIKETSTETQTDDGRITFAKASNLFNIIIFSLPSSFYAAAPHTAKISPWKRKPINYTIESSSLKS